MAIAVVGHDARDVDAEAFVIGRRNVEKRNRAAALLSWRDPGVGAKPITNDDELPADATAGSSIVPAAHSKKYS
jgi:hypothetical protein